MSEEIVYKVVKHDEETEKMYSAMIDSDNLKLEYAIGERTLPKIGMIFAFDSVQSAVDFARSNLHWRDSYNILKCKGDVDISMSASIRYTPYGSADDEDLMEFLKSIDEWDSHGNGRSVYGGTRFCRWVEPIEAVW